MGDTQITPLGDLSKPANTLIKRISDAIGGIFKPYQIVRVAKAEAEADRIRAQAQLQVTDLQRRALHRFLEEEAKKQLNIEEITRRSLPQLEDNSQPDRLTDDWVTNFFDKARLVSDSHMQELWARVLAGEANTPGSFSRKTVNVMGDLDKADAELFATLCRFAWSIGSDATPLIFNVSDSIYTETGVTFWAVSHLESLGLIQYYSDSFSNLVRREVPKHLEVYYFGSTLTLAFPHDVNNQLDIGRVILTNAGSQIMRLCELDAVPGFFDYMRHRWSQHLNRSRDCTPDPAVTPS